MNGEQVAGIIVLIHGAIANGVHDFHQSIGFVIDVLGIGPSC
ncbi:MAG TPA: hypothetical protein VIF10_02465 [Methylobacter sp.]